jgi:hypothetical protein
VARLHRVDGSVLLLSWLVLRRDGRLIWIRWRLSGVVLTDSAGVGVRIIGAVGLWVGGKLGGLDVLRRLYGLRILRVREAL